MPKRILMTGNEAMAQGALDAGCDFYAGYPITPQNELIAYMAEKMPLLNRVFIQAESELGAINMVFGAAAAGARAMTSSSSPGISLKQEGISYIAGAQLPAVIVNVMRGGPGLGNIAAAQSDYFQATRGGGHGDYHCIVLAPFSVEEAYAVMRNAFNLADKYRNPVMVLADGILGQMMEPIELSVVSRQSSAKDRLKTDSRKLAAKDWVLTGCKDREPNVVKSFYMREGDLEKFNLALQKKYQRVKNNEQRFEGLFLDDAKIILVAYGTMGRICRCVVRALRKDGKKIGLIRPITLWPFPREIFSRLSRRPEGRSGVKYLVVEMSYGQMVEDVELALGGKSTIEFFGRSGGGVPTEEEITKTVNKLV